MATSDAPNVIPLAVAADRYQIDYSQLRALVNAGVFTKHVFEGERKRPPIFVFVAEIEAFKRAGLDGVREEQKRPHPALSPA